MSDDEPVRDLTSALRFVHATAARQREDHERVDATLEALMAALIEAGVITDEAIDDHLMAASRTARQRRPEELSVRLWSGGDKYGIPDPGIDCEARMHLCQGRCCSFDFPLSEQDLDEGQVRWRYREPYMVAQRDDGYCVHNDPATRGCGVYAHRPWHLPAVQLPHRQAGVDRLRGAHPGAARRAPAADRDPSPGQEAHAVAAGHGARSGKRRDSLISTWRRLR